VLFGIDQANTIGSMAEIGNYNSTMCDKVPQFLFE
jgi:hypothetical protein